MWHHCMLLPVSQAWRNSVLFHHDSRMCCIMVTRLGSLEYHNELLCILFLLIYKWLGKLAKIERTGNKPKVSPRYMVSVVSVELK